MDSSGELIDLLGPRTAGFDLPIIRGLGGVSVEVRRDRARRASVLLEDLGDLSAEVSEIPADRAGDLMSCFEATAAPQTRGTAQPETRAVLPRPASEAPRALPGRRYFDLRFKDRIYAKPASRDEKSDLSPEISNSVPENKEPEDMARKTGTSRDSTSAPTKVCAIIAEAMDYCGSTWWARPTRSRRACARAWSSTSMPP